MAVYKDLIHGRLKLIVKNSGGYDLNYHINKVAKENNLDERDVLAIFLMTLDKDIRDKYIQLLKKGYSMDYIRKIENTRNQNTKMEMASIMGMIVK